MQPEEKTLFPSEVVTRLLMPGRMESLSTSNSMMSWFMSMSVTGLGVLGTQPRVLTPNCKESIRSTSVQIPWLVKLRSTFAWASKVKLLKTSVPLIVSGRRLFTSGLVLALQLAADTVPSSPRETFGRPLPAATVVFSTFPPLPYGHVVLPTMVRSGRCTSAALTPDTSVSSRLMLKVQLMGMTWP